jgi:hypothetical protein
MRTKYSKAIHDSIHRQLHRFKESGSLDPGNKIRPTTLTEAVKVAAERAYKFVRTEPSEGDTGKRTNA